MVVEVFMLDKGTLMSILQVLAVCVLSVDLLILVGALVLSYILIKYHKDIAAWFEYIKNMRKRRLQDYV